MSSFQAVATAIAAQVGTGNIVGASGAILAGGPGAIFWMWVIAFLGMATIYAEAVLAQHTRIKTERGEIMGGPVYYITHAFKGKFGKFLAGFFAVASVFIDTFVVLTLNALVIICTLYAGDGPLAGCGAAAAQTLLTKTNLAQTAFGAVFGEKLGAILWL